MLLMTGLCLLVKPAHWIARGAVCCKIIIKVSLGGS